MYLGCITKLNQKGFETSIDYIYTSYPKPGCANGLPYINTIYKKLFKTQSFHTFTRLLFTHI